MEGFPHGFKICPVSEEKEELLKLYVGHNDSATVEVEPNGWVLPAGYKEYYKDFKNFQVHEDDVYVMTYPKSGTTWTQEIVWTMQNNPNLDHPMMAAPLIFRSPYFEADALLAHTKTIDAVVKPRFAVMFPHIDQSRAMFLQVVQHAPRPRTIKSHLSFDLLPEDITTKAKVVYTIRDPRDTCISFYHHCQMFMYEDFRGTLDEFVNIFLKDANWHASYWGTVSEAWKRRNDPNVHIIFFEKMKKHPKEEIERLDKFLGTNLTNEQLDKIVHFTSFAEMKKRDDHVCPAQDYENYIHEAMAKKAGGFFRKGETGGWRKVLTDDQKEMFEKWIEEKCPDMVIMDTINKYH